MRLLKHLVCWLLIVFVTVPATAAGEPPAAGGILPDIRLAMPADPEHRKYLGLQGKASFAIPDIDAEIVIVEIFSMYCPHCQREAPTINEIYAKIEANPNLQDRVKLIGIGVGNSAMEVDYFRKAFDVPFPLFTDGDFIIHKKLGEVRTPFFIGVRNQADGGHQIFYAQLGGPHDAGKMLDELIRKAGLTED